MTYFIITILLVSTSGIRGRPQEEVTDATVDIEEDTIFALLTETTKETFSNIETETITENNDIITTVKEENILAKTTQSGLSDVTDVMTETAVTSSTNLVTETTIKTTKDLVIDSSEATPADMIITPSTYLTENPINNNAMTTTGEQMTTIKYVTTSGSEATSQSQETTKYENTEEFNKMITETRELTTEPTEPMDTTISVSKSASDELVTEPIVNIQLAETIDAFSAEESADRADDNFGKLINDEVSVTPSFEATHLEKSTEHATKEDYEDKESAVDDDIAEEIDNIISDIVYPVPVIIEEFAPTDLSITVQPGDSAVFRQGTVLGLSCDAHSALNNQIDFSWTKNGRFINTQSSRVFRESIDNGNIIILAAGPEDEGLYQCMASNNDGVVFARVTKVRQRVETQLTRGRGRALGGRQEVALVMPLNPLQGDLSDLRLQVVLAEKQS